MYTLKLCHIPSNPLSFNQIDTWFTSNTCKSCSFGLPLTLSVWRKEVILGRSLYDFNNSQDLPSLNCPEAAQKRE